jgi:hypothetical protein
MNAEDKVILWQSDPGAGVYALGKLLGKPYPENEGGWQVDIQYEPLLKLPIFKSDLIKHPVLRDLLILKMPHGRNPTRVTEEQWEAMNNLISKLAVGSA